MKAPKAFFNVVFNFLAMLFCKACAIGCILAFYFQRIDLVLTFIIQRITALTIINSKTTCF